MIESRKFVFTPELVGILTFGVMTVAFLLSLQENMGDMRERMARVETRLTHVETSLTGVEARLTSVEAWLTDVDTRLTRLESLFQEHFEDRLSSGPLGKSNS